MARDISDFLGLGKIATELIKIFRPGDQEVCNTRTQIARDRSTRLGWRRVACHRTEDGKWEMNPLELTSPDTGDGPPN